MTKSKKVYIPVIILMALGLIMIIAAVNMMSKEEAVPPVMQHDNIEANEPAEPDGMNETTEELPKIQMKGLQEPNYNIVLNRIPIDRSEIAGKFYLAENRTAFVLYHSNEAVGFEKNLEKGNYTLSFLMKGTYMPPIKMHLYVNETFRGDVIVNAINLWQGVEVDLGELQGSTRILLVYFGDEAKYNPLTGEYYDDRNAYLKEFYLYKVQ
jgi:hypothetical protein